MTIPELAELSTGKWHRESECNSSTRALQMTIPELVELNTRNGTVCSECNSGMVPYV
jgi:hypothetical protein